MTPPIRHAARRAAAPMHRSTRWLARAGAVVLLTAAAMLLSAAMLPVALLWTVPALILVGGAA